LDRNGTITAIEGYTNPAESGYETLAFLRTRGKAVATKTGILKNDGTTPTTYLVTTTFYDKEYSIIQVNKQNHLSGSDISSSAYDFANRLIKSRRDHTAVVSGASKSYTTREEYVYDHASRLRFTRHKINSANWVVTSAPVYDEMGRLLDKRLHASNYDGVSAVTTASTFNYLQSLDYSYNIRNWLTGINDPATCTLQSGDQLVDVFRMQLNYETSVNGSTAQYNGNISSMQWNTHLSGTCSQRQLYMFSYDAGNRLTAAAHRNWSGTAWTDPNQYNESGITYDLNGNLKTYTRRGLTAPSTFGDIDILSYTYGDAHLAIGTSDSKTNTKYTKYYIKVAQQRCQKNEDAFIPRLRTLQELAILVQHDDDDADEHDPEEPELLHMGWQNADIAEHGDDVAGLF
jgi:hypothetical protein